MSGFALFKEITTRKSFPETDIKSGYIRLPTSQSNELKTIYLTWKLTALAAL
jgi:hypothetical protein